MRKSRFSDDQIIGVIKEHDAGAATKDLCRKHGISTNIGTSPRVRSLNFRLADHPVEIKLDAI